MLQNEADLFNTIAGLAVSSRRSTPTIRLALKREVSSRTREECLKALAQAVSYIVLFDSLLEALIHGRDCQSMSVGLCLTMVHFTENTG